MNILKFQGDIGLTDVFNQHKVEIYDNLFKAIHESYLNDTINEVTIVKISINEIEYTINLNREKFLSGMEGALSFYESCEEYEKCAECLKIINALKNKQMEIN